MAHSSELQPLGYDVLFWHLWRLHIYGAQHTCKQIIHTYVLAIAGAPQVLSHLHCDCPAHLVSMYHPLLTFRGRVLQRSVIYPRHLLASLGISALALGFLSWLLSSLAFLFTPFLLSLNLNS